MNNDTTVNVQIKARDDSAQTIQGAITNFNNLWKQMGGGLLAANLVQTAFNDVVGTVQNAITQAGNFQQQLTMLVTGAGESQNNLTSVGNGIKQIAIDTGTTLEQLTQGAYQIESAGFHGADALNILKMAAEGAKADGADLGTVTNALTTIMHDYNIPASQAAQVTDQMIAAVARGKMHMQDFAGSLSTVLPIADQVGLSFDQVAGAESTLTAAGVNADQATQDLHSLIASLIAPTSQQVTAMQQMGLSSVDLSKNLGKNGLTGTLQMMSDAITQHMGPDGLVIQSAMKNATLATQDMQKEIAAMPAPVQKLAQGLLDGSISFKQYRKESQALPEGMTNLAKQFEGTYNQAHSFNQQLVAGINASPTYAAQLKSMTGQTDAMNAVMMLTGSNFGTFQNNVNAVAGAAKNTGKNISDWQIIQGTFNQKWSEFQALMQVAAVNVGNALIALIMWFGKLWESIQPVLQIIANMFRPALNQLKHALGKLATAFDPIWQKIKGPVMEALGGVVVIILGPVIAALAALLAAAYVFITIATWVADAITWIIKFYETVWYYITHAGQTFNSLKGIVLNSLSDAKNWLYDAGKAIVDGLTKGVKDHINSAVDAVKNLGKGIEKGFRDAIGWHSPSTLFMDAGQSIAQGLIIGMQGMQSQTALATTQLITGAPILGGNNPASNTVNNYNNTSGGNRSTFTIQQLVVQAPNGATLQSILQGINQGSLNASQGLTPQAA